MKRGEVWLVCFDASVGGEVRKTRPAAIVSNDMANRHLNRVQVVPLTSSTGKLYPSESYAAVRGRKHKAMADQLSTVSKRRLLRKLGQLSASDLEGVERVVMIQLGLSDRG